MCSTPHTAVHPIKMCTKTLLPDNSYKSSQRKKRRSCANTHELSCESTRGLVCFQTFVMTRNNTSSLQCHATSCNYPILAPIHTLTNANRPDKNNIWHSMILLFGLAGLHGEGELGITAKPTLPFVYGVTRMATSALM